MSLLEEMNTFNQYKRYAEACFDDFNGRVNHSIKAVRLVCSIDPDLKVYGSTNQTEVLLSLQKIIQDLKTKDRIEIAITDIIVHELTHFNQNIDFNRYGEDDEYTNNIEEEADRSSAKYIDDYTAYLEGKTNLAPISDISPNIEMVKRHKLNDMLVNVPDMFTFSDIRIKIFLLNGEVIEFGISDIDIYEFNHYMEFIFHNCDINSFGISENKRYAHIICTEVMLYPILINPITIRG